MDALREQQGGAGMAQVNDNQSYLRSRDVTRAQFGRVHLWSAGRPLDVGGVPAAAERLVGRDQVAHERLIGLHQRIFGGVLRALCVEHGEIRAEPVCIEILGAERDDVICRPSRSVGGHAPPTFLSVWYPPSRLRARGGPCAQSNLKCKNYARCGVGVLEIKLLR